MRRRTKWILASVFMALGAGAIAVPGPQQALWPRLNGLHELAPNIYSDGETSLEMLINARLRVQEFYGELHGNPRIILCNTDACIKNFWHPDGPRGKTWGPYLIVIAPRGMNEMILTHELAHVELHWYLTLGDMVFPRFPAWFNEGLAGYISEDDRLIAPDRQALDRIEQAWGARDWNRAVDEMGWRNAYGAGLAKVSDMIALGGPNAVRALIIRVGAGEDFSAVYQELFPDPD